MSTISARVSPQDGHPKPDPAEKRFCDGCGEKRHLRELWPVRPHGDQGGQYLCCDHCLHTEGRIIRCRGKCRAFFPLLALSDAGLCPDCCRDDVAPVAPPVRLEPHTPLRLRSELAGALGGS